MVQRFPSFRTRKFFEETVYDYDTLKIRLRETAFLTKNLRIVLRDDREDKKEKIFHYEGGIKEFVTYLNRSNVPLYDTVIYCEGKKDNVLVKLPCSIMIPTRKIFTAL